jgi:hypothetical protein
MMGFIGFPSETTTEASPFEFLEKNRKFWALNAIGNYVLTLGAIVAKRNSDFKIERIII